MRERVKVIILVILVVVVIAIPLALRAGSGFGGTDNRAVEVVGELAPGYRPWFRSLWQPPDKDIEGMLFAIQAAVGAGFLGYYLGYVHGRRKGGKK